MCLSIFLPVHNFRVILQATIAAFAASELQAHPRIVELEKTAEGMDLTSWVARSRNVQSTSPVYGYADRHGGLRRGDQLVSVNGQVSEHTGWLNAVLCYICVLLRSLEDMDHEDAVKVLKNAQGIVSVVNHTTVVTCVFFIAGTLKMVVKYFLEVCTCVHGQLFEDTYGYCILLCVCACHVS